MTGALRLTTMLVLLAGLFGRPARAEPEETKLLWEIGTVDDRAGEFLYGPGGYRSYARDGLLIVGHSKAKTDWPYVHPGPDDLRAGGEKHSFSIAFKLADAPKRPCRLIVDLLDTHNLSPSRLIFKVNGRTIAQHDTPASKTDLSIQGKPELGQEHRIEINVPGEKLRAGLNEIVIENSRGSWVLYDWLGFQTPGSLQLLSLTAAQRSELQKRLPSKPKLQRIVVVFKTHFDIGYSDLARNVVKQYRTSMIDRALGVIEANRRQPAAEQFAWTVPGWPMAQILWTGQTAERCRAVEKALKDGHLVLHGLPFTTHTETLELEDLVRGLGYSSRIARRLGLELPRDAKMTDVPCHSWATATLLKHAGIEFIHIGCNDASMPPRVPLLFRWEGPDGSRVLTMLTNTYGTWPFPPKDWPHKTWLALLHTGDNAGPPSPDHVRSVLQTYRRRLPGVKVTIGRMADFADAILAEDPDLPVVRGDMVDTWIYGPMSAPAGCKTARSVRPALPATESLHTQLRTWGADAPDSRAALAKAYQASLLYGEHTWGLATQHYVKLAYGEAWQRLVARGLDKNHKLLDESWDEHEEYINGARQLIEPLLQEHLKVLASSVNAKGRRIVVYNPLPWRRSGIVTVRTDQTGLRAVRAVDANDVSQVVADATTVRFLARDVPSMGYRTYVPVAAADAPPVGLKVDEATNTIEGPFFRAVLDAESGVIRSLVDRHSGRELVDASAPHGFGAYLYERHDGVSRRLRAQTIPRIARGHARQDGQSPRRRALRGRQPDRHDAPLRAGCAGGFVRDDGRGKPVPAARRFDSPDAVQRRAGGRSGRLPQQTARDLARIRLDLPAA
ncbi:MAG: polysaccharide lyase family protein [Planctomycetota bacterium]|jgi:hypothetical protein